MGSIRLVCVRVCMRACTPTHREREESDLGQCAVIFFFFLILCEMITEMSSAITMWSRMEISFVA